MMTDSRIAELPTSDNTAPQLLHYRHCLAAMQCNPPREACFQDECSECPGSEPPKVRLHDFDSKGIDEVEFKQWISTDRSNLETVILSVEEFVALFSEMLNKLQRRDFIARRQAQLLQGTKNAHLNSSLLVTLRRTMHSSWKMHRNHSIGTISIDIANMPLPEDFYRADVMVGRKRL